MEQGQIAIKRERMSTVLLAVAGCSVLTFSVAETTASMNFIQFMLAVLLAGVVILADRYPIHLTRGTKASMTSLPIYLGMVFLPAPIAILVAGGGILASNLLARTERGLLPRDIISATGQWMVIVFLGHQVNHLALPVLDRSFTRLILLVASALTLLIADFTIFSLTNSFVLKEPFLRTLKTAVHAGVGIEGIQLLIAIFGALAIYESIWSLPLLIVAAIATYLTFKNIKEVKQETVRLLEDMADIVDLRDIYTGGHSKRVADLVHQTLIQLNIYGPEATLIETAARLHDIGKIGIPDSILQKPDKLSPEEMSIMQFHSEKGEKLIVKYEDFSRGAAIIKHHHESWNGHGYPGRLKDYEIPFGSRVIAVADSFDAMTSDRPYRKKLSPRQAVQILLEGRGKQWDPSIVDAFAESIASELDDSIQNSLSETEISLALSNTISTPSNA